MDRTTARPTPRRRHVYAGLAFVAGAGVGVTAMLRHQPPAPRGVETKAEMDTNAAELVLIARTHAARAEAGLAALLVVDNLMELARWRVADMAARGYFAHDIPDDGDFLTVLQAWGVPYIAAGENLGAYQADAPNAVETIFDGWLASPSHRDNVLGAAYTRLGVGVAVDDDGRLLCAALFSREAQDG